MSSNRPTRRGFLKGRTLLREMPADDRDLIDPSSADSAPSPLAAARGRLLASVRRRAMACDWEVQLSAIRDDDSMEHVFAALDLVESLEDQMTVYRDDSEIIRINRLAAAGHVPVEPRLFAVLQLAARVHRETDGALDITSGPLSNAWGFSRRHGRVPSDAEISAALARVGMQHVLLEETNHSIAFSRSGVSINLNSVGKGYALDRMAELLAEGGVNDYLLHGGKSSVLARGDQPGKKQGVRHGKSSTGSREQEELNTSCWSIGLRHPLRPGERLATFCLRDQALSTSGAGTQFFHRRGRRYGHILDPRTGRPAEGLYSCTVIAPTAVEAEALSTAFYVMGPDKVADFLAERPELAALLVAPALREGEVRLHAFNLDDGQWRQSG